ncbi:MAG: multidrug efflux SMR transporter [Planctomycetota bacterium]|jgi:quaternary ammonium compound-resistance protein SugE|nr:multidrug efflux SMR transporter [Planctomycetota bacterium]
MVWIWLIASGISEIAWAASLKQAKGFTDLWWSVAAVITTITTVFTLSQALKGLPLGLAYAVWTAVAVIGTAGVALATGERFSFLQLCCVAAIVAGAVGLKVLTPESP